MNYSISHPHQCVECKIHLPASKSISNRILIIRSLCSNHFNIHNLSNSDDTRILDDVLNNNIHEINLGSSGSTFRFLVSYLSIQDNKEFLLKGSERLSNRPISHLVDALLSIGAEINYCTDGLSLPLQISGKKINGGKISIRGDVSSQFISSLLLIAPVLENGLEIEIIGQLVSRSYIDMTLCLMTYFNIEHTWNDNLITIRKQDYQARDFHVESDWSAASFWMEIASLSRVCNIQLLGLFNNSIQGDACVLQIYKKIGLDFCFDQDSLFIKKVKEKENSKNIPTAYNLMSTPDLFQPIACTLAVFNKEIQFTGLYTLKDKETDRIEALSNEFSKLNIHTQIQDSSFLIKESQIKCVNRSIRVYEDHRMAMSFAPLCMKVGELNIQDIEVVSKSYPNYWEDLRKAGFIISLLSD